MKPVTGNITGYRLTGNRLTTLVLSKAMLLHNQNDIQKHGSSTFLSLWLTVHPIIRISTAYIRSV